MSAWSSTDGSYQTAFLNGILWNLLNIGIAIGLLRGRAAGLLDRLIGPLPGPCYASRMPDENLTESLVRQHLRDHAEKPAAPLAWPGSSTCSPAAPCRVS